jgi:hypothetical protein
MSHEAKPHLPGAVLILLAVIAALRFIDTQRTRWWLIAGALCGAAAGMVLSATVAILILPTMVMLARIPWRRRLAVACISALVATAVYFATNPYVLIHLVRDREILRSNLANSSAMYHAGDVREGLMNSLLLLREGASLPLLLAGSLAMVLLLIRRRDCNALVLGVPCAVVLIQFVALAAGKPGEYARFAMLPDIALAIACGIALGALISRNAQRVPIAILLVIFTAAPSWFYLVGFARDSTPTSSTRLEDAAWLDQLHRAGGATTLAIFAEPAPYSLPPVDLFGWRIVLVPRGASVEDATKLADVVIRPVDALPAKREPIGEHLFASLTGPADRFPTRISWAGKPFEIWARRDVIERATQAPRLP